MATTLTPRRMIRERGRSAGAAAPGGGAQVLEFARPQPIAQMAGLRAMGSVLDRMAGQAGRLFDKEFEKEARRVAEASEQAGRKYGFDADLPDLARLPMGDTIAEQAFRKGAVLSAMLGVEMQARADVAEMEIQFEADPDGFMAALQGRARGFASNLPPDMEMQAREVYGQLGNAAIRRLHEQRRALDIDNGRAHLFTAMEGLQAQTAWAARAGDYETALFNLGRMAEVFIAAGPVAEGGAGLMAATERRKLLAEIQKDVQQNYLLGYLDRAGVSDRTLLSVRNRQTGDPIADMIIGQMSPNDHDRLVARVEQEHEAAIRKAYTQEQRAYMWAERERRQTEGQMSKAGDALLASGDLTIEWIEQNRGQLSESDHRYFYRQLTDERNVQTPPAIYADLRSRAAMGEDVRQEARDLLVSHRMSQGDYDKIVNRVEAEAAEAQFPHWYKRGERFIRDTLRVSEMNPNPADAQMQAAAMDEWTEWSRVNPEATEQQARDAYQRLAREYRFVDLTETAVALPIPSSLRMQQHRRPTRQEVQQAMRRVAEAVQAGTMDEAEAERQASMLAQWMRVASGGEP